jgi:hypothetical protein
MRKTTLAVTTATAAALAAAVAVPVLGQAQDAPPAAETLTFQEDMPKVVIDDVAPKAKRGDTLSQGDRIVTHGGLFDAGRKRLGSLSVTCTAVGATRPVPEAELFCQAVYDVTGRGQVVASGRFSLEGRIPLPVVGGTGQFAGVTGSVLSNAKPAKGFDDVDVLTLQR